MKEPDVVCEVACRCALGEGPIWVPATQTIWWVDIKQARLHSFEVCSRRHLERVLPRALTSLGLRKGGGFVGTLLDRFVLLDADAKIIEWFEPVEPGLPRNRFNDAKVALHGDFWAGTMDEDLAAASGSLYRFSHGRWTKKDTGYEVSNGPAFSLDGKTLYHTSTARRLIFAFDLDEDGTIENKRVHIAIPEADGLPDGMTVDADGNLWVCHYFGGRITQFAPNGRKLRHIPIPVSCVTSCVFGGEALDRLFVTTAAQNVSDEAGRAREPLAGALFSLDVGVRGVRPSVFTG